MIKSSAEARLLCYQQLSKSISHQPELSSKEKECKNFCNALADDLMKIPTKRLLSTKIKLLELVQSELELSECKKSSNQTFFKILLFFRRVFFLESFLLVLLKMSALGKPTYNTLV